MAIVQTESRPGIVYLIHALETPFYKIGYSVNLNYRLSELQIASPYTLILAGAMPGTRDQERYIQRQFKKWHHRGEWYKFDDQSIPMAEFWSELEYRKWEAEHRECMSRRMVTMLG